MNNYLCRIILYNMVNPFIITGRLADEYFCDRVEETSRIVKCLTNGGNMTLVSQRRMGKSKLVMHSYGQKEIADNYYTFYIDILHTTSIRELTYAFGSAVFNVLRSKSRRMLMNFAQGLKSINAKFGFDAMNGTPTFSLELGDIAQPEFTLAEIFSCLEKADKPCIVTFDEFQQIAKYPEKNVEALLRSHIQHLENVHFLFSGSERHLVTEMFQDSARPFYNSTSMLELAPIHRDIYADFVTHWMEHGERQITREDVFRVYDTLEGNTYYMQKTFHNLYAESLPGTICNFAAIAHTLEGMLEEAAANFRLTLSRITEKQKELLYAIASEGTATSITSGKFIRRYALSSASSVQAAAKKLSEYDLITNDGGAYTINDVLFRKYLLRLKDEKYPLA